MSNPADASIPRHVDIMERIVPVIKVIADDADGSHVLELQDEQAPVSKSFAGNLIVMYAEDLPSHFAYLSKKRVRELGLDMEELHSLAVRNLSHRVPQIKIHGAGPHYMVTAGGNFEATLLLHPSLWDSLSTHLQGAPMAAVPTRDLLFVTGTESEEGRAFLKKMAEQEHEDKRYALSKLLFVKGDDAWAVAAPFIPAASGVHAPKN
jgi:uncharacterized protein YtpQ (UPF0354 family)